MIKRSAYMIILLLLFLMYHIFNVQNVFAANKEQNYNDENFYEQYELHKLNNDVDAAADNNDNKNKDTATEAFCYINNITLENSEILGNDIYNVIPELNNKIVNTRLLLEQIRHFNKQNDTQIIYKYELSTEYGYNLFIQVENRNNYEAKESRGIPNENTVFTLREIFINTNNLLPDNDEELKKVYEDYLGKDVGMSDLEDIAGRISTYYRKRGYPAATAYIPPQKSADKSIRIEVEPGRYGVVGVENNSRLKTSVLKRFTDNLKRGDIIKSKDVEKVVYDTIGMGGVKAGAVMRAGEKSGETDITLRVENGKLNSYTLYAENHGSKTSG